MFRFSWRPLWQLALDFDKCIFREVCVCVCARARARAGGIVSMDKILRFTDTSFTVLLL